MWMMGLVRSWERSMAMSGMVFEEHSCLVILPILRWCQQSTNHL